MRAAAMIVLTAGMLAAPALADEGQTSRAVRLLLGMSSAPIRGKLGCEGELTGVRAPRVGDLVASRLSVFETGENRISGSCNAARRCSVTISHANGEDVSGAEFRFRLIKGVASAQSLRCVLTP